ncbi:hypothetical protein BOX15_Mlig012572g1, partial [Macrostomum lignano]
DSYSDAIDAFKSQQPFYTPRTFYSDLKFNIENFYQEVEKCLSDYALKDFDSKNITGLSFYKFKKSDCFSKVTKKCLSLSGSVITNESIGHATANRKSIRAKFSQNDRRQFGEAADCQCFAMSACAALVHCLLRKHGIGLEFFKSSEQLEVLIVYGNYLYLWICEFHHEIKVGSLLNYHHVLNALWWFRLVPRDMFFYLTLILHNCEDLRSTRYRRYIEEADGMIFRHSEVDKQGKRISLAKCLMRDQLNSNQYAVFDSHEPASLTFYPSFEEVIQKVFSEYFKNLNERQQYSSVILHLYKFSFSENQPVNAAI